MQLYTLHSYKAENPQNCIAICANCTDPQLSKNILTLYLKNLKPYIKVRYIIQPRQLLNHGFLRQCSVISYERIM